jgi:outer membrane protein TolC
MLLSLIFRAGRLCAGAILFAGFNTALVTTQVMADQPVPPPMVTHLPAVLTLKDAIAIALREQPAQAISEASVNSALGSREETKSQYFPTVTPSYTFENNRSVEYGITQNQIVTSSINPGSGTNGTGTTVNQVSGDNVNVIRGGGATISLKQTMRLNRRP